jgi:hypothetical protein
MGSSFALVELCCKQLCHALATQIPLGKSLTFDLT